MEYRQAKSLKPEQALAKVSIEGVKLRRANELGDDRGVISELIDVRDEYWTPEFKYLYKGTCRPGKFKGWGVHDHHIDRYIIVHGEMLLVLYDDREGSPTFGQVQEFYMTHTGNHQITIPAGVWHLHQNIGTEDLIFLNSPSEPYDHESPDKRRLPVVNDVIPYTLKPVVGW